MNRFFFRISLTIILFGNIYYTKAQTVPQTTTPQTPINAPAQTQNTPAAIPANASNVSDATLVDMVQKAQAAGMSDAQVRQMALQKGMSPNDIDILQSRVNSLRKAGNDQPQKDPKDNTVKRLTDDNTITNTKQGGLMSDGLPIFGSDLFNNANLTFEPNLRIATPVNYRLGPDDQLVIDVFGKSQVEWKPVVTPEGNVQLPGIGPVNVGGKTIEQADEIIKAKLIANHYAIGNGTNFSLSIGNIRTIRVKLVGEITKPGTYNLNSFSTVFNALYQSGGPNANGSFRQIELIRNNKLIRTLDVYDFLLKASQKDDLKLEDGDIIRVPSYNVHVSMTGQVKRQAVYEVLPAETLNDVVRFAGGFTDIAYTATIKAIQLTDQDKKVKEIKAADFNNYIPLRGDTYIVDKILDAFENRVTIVGAIVRPNVYELSKDLTLSGLIKKASGLKPDAFQSRGFITRLKSDNSTEIISFDVKRIVNNTSPDILLKKEDVITIPSIFDLRDQYIVTINGDIRAGGVFQYADNMRVEDLITLAGGFSESASPKRIEIGRRIDYGNPGQLTSPISQIFTVDVDRNLKLSDSSFLLKPYDVVSIFNLPGYEIQRVAQIHGEVFFPGPYTIKSKDERISDLVKRSGGVSASADINGAIFYRGGNIVAVNLKQILDEPNSNDDLYLKDGDELRIPERQQTVKVGGEVTYPSSVVFDPSLGFTEYIDHAGGFTLNALRRKAYVVYANGRVRSTHHFLFFKFYPSVDSGSQIVIPTKPPHDPVTLTSIGGLASGLLSAAAILIGIISLTK